MGEQPNVPSLLLGVSDRRARGCEGMAVLRVWGESGGTGMGAAGLCESRHQIALEDKTRRSLPCLGGQSLLCLCCLEGGSFTIRLGMLSSVYIPQ